MSRRWHHWRPRFRKHREEPKWEPEQVDHLTKSIDQLKYRVKSASKEDKRELLEKLLVLQTPRAALAQQQMDRHHGGYHNREKRLYDLIDFNDTFVSSVLAQPHDKLNTFVARIKGVMERFTASQHSLMFTDEQFDAIVRGLAREIAVYLGARSQGLRAVMTSRTEDAFGIDMIVRDDETGVTVNIDVKTPSAFRYRLEELERDGRISTEELLQADKNDFVTVINRHNEELIPVTVMCVRPERLGDVVDFRFENEPALEHLIRTIMASRAPESARQQGKRMVR